MIAKRIAVLGTVCLLMGGCSQPMNVPTTYSSLPIAAAAEPTVTVSDDPQASLPPVVVPGQMRASALSQVRPGVDPNAVLQASAAARAAWVPLKPADLTLPAAVTSRSAPPRGNGAAGDPSSTASVFASVGTAVPQRPGAESYDREAVMDSLVREGRRDARPICDRC